VSATKPLAQITVYTLPWCMHCACARAILKRRGLSFEEVDGSAVTSFRRQLAAVTGGVTVPQIVIDGTPIGGADQLARLDRLGVLAAIAGREQFPIARELRHVSPRSVARWAAARLRGQRDVTPVQRVQVLLDRQGRLVEARGADAPSRKGQTR
jgi:glutaredoxin 3